MVLKTGKTTRSHDELVRRGVEVAEGLRDVRLREAVSRAGQRLHANYYHGFLSLDEFGELYQEILYAIERFKLVLQSELSRLLGQKP